MLAALAALIAAAYGGWIWFSGRTSDPPGPAPTASSPAAPSPAASSSAGADPSTQDLCWSASSTPVSCNLPHRYQAAGPSSSCDREKVFDYLGGEDGIDAVRIVLDPQLAPGRCVVDAGSEVQADFAGVLRLRAGDAWRSCLAGELNDVATHRFVGCEQAHQGEILSAPTTAEASMDDCRKAAGSYMSRSSSTLSQELTVQPFTPVQEGEGQGRCEVWIISGKPLDGSVRRVGNAQLPRAS